MNPAASEKPEQGEEMKIVDFSVPRLTRHCPCDIMPSIKDDRGAELMSIPAEALNRPRNREKGSFAEMEHWIEKRSVGRQEKMLPTVTVCGALSSFPMCFSDGKRLWRCVLWPFLIFDNEKFARRAFYCLIPGKSQ